MNKLSEIKLFVSGSHSCSYLPGEQSTTAFIDPQVDIDSNIYSILSSHGFRRSGAHIYRPHCQNCQACIPIRIAVTEFAPNRAQKRCIKHNGDVICRVISSIDTDEHYELYEDYINTRHYDGDMFPASYKQYREFLSSEWGMTRYLEFREASNNTLLAVAVTDELNNALSALYTFYHPLEEKRSLGRFAILKQIEMAKQKGLDFLYLGYWIKASQKMRYKTEYRPFQIIVNNKWVTVA